jgi:hypothetical protein
MELLDGVRYSVREFKQKDCFVVFDLVQELSSHSVRDPVVLEVVLGNRTVGLYYRYHFPLDLLLYTVSDVLLVPQDVQLHV